MTDAGADPTPASTRLRQERLPVAPTRTRCLSVIMPVFNEEGTAAQVARRVLDLDLPVRLELVAVDDGSSDGTVGSLREIHDPRFRLLVCAVNGGKGSAIKRGIDAVTGDIVVIQDADFEYDPTQFAELLEPILSGETQVVYGSRFMGHVEGMRWQNRLANSVLSTLTNVLFGARLTDMETCYKMMDTKLLRSLDLQAQRFDIEPEITARLLRRRQSIMELPIRYEGRTHSEGKKIGWSDGVKAITTLISWRLRIQS